MRFWHNIENPAGWVDILQRAPRPAHALLGRCAHERLCQSGARDRQTPRMRCARKTVRVPPGTIFAMARESPDALIDDARGYPRHRGLQGSSCSARSRALSHSIKRALCCAPCLANTVRHGCDMFVDQIVRKCFRENEVSPFLIIPDPVVGHLVLSRLERERSRHCDIERRPREVLSLKGVGDPIPPVGDVGGVQSQRQRVPSNLG